MPGGGNPSVCSVLFRNETIGGVGYRPEPKGKNVMKNSLIPGVCLLVLAIPAAAAGPYYYLLEVEPATVPGGPALQDWYASWQSDKKLDLTFTNVMKQTSFATSNDPISGFPLTSLRIARLKKQSKPGVLPIYATATWGAGTPPEVDYQWEFISNGEPTEPDKVGVYNVALTAGEYVLTPFSSGGSATLTIQKMPFLHPVGMWQRAKARVSVVSAVVTPAPSIPVSVVLGFVDGSGNPLGPSSTVPLIAGQVASLDLDAATLAIAQGGHMQVRPTVSEAPGAFTPPLQATVEVFDVSTGSGVVLTSVNGAFPLPSIFGRQGVITGQTIRITAVAESPDSCYATLSFVNGNGNPIGTSQPVNLGPGQAMHVDLNGNSLGLSAGQRAEVQPVVKLQTQGISTCAASAEVFDNTTGATLTYQTAVSSNNN
jgi:hypothetical protein